MAVEKVQYQCCLLDTILSKQKYHLPWYNQLQSYPIMISGIPVKKQAIQIDAQITMNVYNHIAEKSHVENEMSKMNLPETVPAVV